MDIKTAEEIVKAYCVKANPKLKEVIGHEPTLADVLLAIWKKTPSNKTRITLESDGQFMVFNPLLNQRFAKETWSLSLPFKEQSDEVKLFLAELLK